MSKVINILFIKVGGAEADGGGALFPTVPPSVQVDVHKPAIEQIQKKIEINSEGRTAENKQDFKVGFFMFFIFLKCV